jgi:hypothetical protein
MGRYVHDLSPYGISNAYNQTFSLVMIVIPEATEYLRTSAMLILPPQKITFIKAAYFSKIYNVILNYCRGFHGL